MTTRDYSSVYSIKDFALNEVAPKYFDLGDVNLLNVGLLGYATELIANTTEDTFNAFSTYIKEISPNIAQIPETLYNHAARLQIENLFATPSAMSAIIFINEDDITKKGTPKGDRIEFVLDSDLIVDIEGKQFMLDYDVMITAKPYRGDWIYTAAYDFTFKNSLSDVINPYIKTRRVPQSNAKYLGLIVKVRQVNRFEQAENIINNDKVNLPTLNFNFHDQLANFEVFYKAPDSNQYIQLQKLLFNSPPIKNPFCFYRIKDDTTVEISFTLRDNYFQPKFNSDIRIVYYTTTGAAGVFPFYNGANINVIPQSQTYEYNNQIILFAVPQSESVGGRDKVSLEELRSIIIERSSTSGAYNNESDLQTYFSNFKWKNKTDILFIKQRDDALLRLFAAFAIFRDENNDIYPTNTVNANLYTTDFDIEYAQSDRYILKPGHLFRYKGAAKDLVEVIPGKMLKDDLSTITDEFVYTSPYLMSVSKKPAIVGYYLNSIVEKLPLDYNYVNSESSVQFICNNLDISRNALAGEDSYTLRLMMMPATDADMQIVDKTTGVDLGNMLVRGVAEDVGGTELCIFNFTLKGYDKANKIYTFEAKLNTDDYMTVLEKFQVTNVNDIADESPVASKLIPMNNCKINFYTFYKYTDLKLPHKFDYLPGLQPYSLTNIYSTDQNRINFITPVNMMRSRLKFMPIDATNYYMFVTFIPFVKAATLKDPSKFTAFLSALYRQYDFIQGTLDKITNNFGVDMKFYNTYGRSKNFSIGDNNESLDKVNIKVAFRLYLKIGAVESDVVTRVKAFIKDYIENVNDKGYNSIFVSNLTQAILNTFSTEVDHLKFTKINNYDSSVQTLQNRGKNIDLMSKDERQNYVPEYLTIGLDDISIDIASF